jgi:hypothetical protein
VREFIGRELGIDESSKPGFRELHVCLGSK